MGLRPQPVVHESDPVNLEWPVSSQQGWLTPVSRFFQRNHFRRPDISPASGAISFGGEVERPFRLEVGELARLPGMSVWSVLECSGNKRSYFRPKPEGTPWLEGAVGNAEWTGVRLRDLLHRAGLKPGAVEVWFAGADAGRFKETGAWVHYERSLPMEAALHPDILVAYAMNGEPLPAEHGGPVRLVVPGWYGMAWVKWLRGVEVRRQPFRGPFQVRDYVYIPAPGAYDEAVPVTLARVNSVILSPADGAVVRPGRVEVRGLAWSGAAPVARVEVSLDGGHSWGQAELGQPVADRAWRQWSFSAPGVMPGEHLVLARAADEAGHIQPMEAEWNAKGYGNNSVARAQINATLRPQGLSRPRPAPLA